MAGQFLPGAADEEIYQRKIRNYFGAPLFGRTMTLKNHARILACLAAKSSPASAHV
jgi:hypothetical protein